MVPRLPPSEPPSARPASTPESGRAPASTPESGPALASEPASAPPSPLASEASPPSIWASVGGAASRPPPSLLGVLPSSPGALPDSASSPWERSSVNGASLGTILASLSLGPVVESSPPHAASMPATPQTIATFHGAQDMVMAKSPRKRVSDHLRHRRLSLSWFSSAGERKKGSIELYRTYPFHHSVLPR